MENDSFDIEEKLDVEDVGESESHEEIAEISNEGVNDYKKLGMGIGIGFALGGILTYLQKRKTRKALKQLEEERLKNKAYQEIILKHQAQINAIKDRLERQEYKNRLWEEVQTLSED